MMRKRTVFPVVILAVVASALLMSMQVVKAKDAPADPCSLLTPAQLAKVHDQPFGPAKSTTAPAAVQDHVTGIDCNYDSSSGSPLRLFLRIYFDPSVAVAKDTFNALCKFYGPNKPVTGNWDSAYFDSRHGIHVQKGRARYYLGLTPVGADIAKTEKQLTDLATAVAGQL
jgi:hypothetical protein